MGTMLTVMDHFSKWAEAYMLRGHKAPTVAKILMEQLFSSFGMPCQLLSVQGSQCGSDIFLEISRWMGIDKIRTSPSRPACNCVRAIPHYFVFDARKGRQGEPARLGYESPICFGCV